MNTKINDYITWVGKTGWELKNFMEMNLLQSMVHLIILI